MKRILMVSLLAGLVLGACQKKIDDPDIDPTPDPDPPVGGVSNIVKDSAMFWAANLYLWYDQIPATFNHRSYNDPNEIMQAIRPYSKEPNFTNPVDRWSFGVLKREWDNVSSGVAADLGMGIFFMSSTDLRVSYVEPAGAAGKAGVQRSWRIAKINGSSNINTTDASINFIVDAIYGGDPATIEFVKPDATTQSLTLTPVSYQEQPILLDSVYQQGGQNIGYLVYNSFLGDVNKMKLEFKDLFDKFQAQNVNKMVVDLRYNGGGFVSLWEELADYLAPASANGQVMYAQEFNDNVAEYWDTAVNFQKKGTLEIQDIVFIISQNTASASEGLINSLTPHMNVKITGPSPSNGKPVGYAPWATGDWYVFPVLFRTVNSIGSGDYFDGFQPEVPVADGLDKAWGDIEEDCLASALRFLTTGQFRTMSVIPSRATPEYLNNYEKLPAAKKWKVTIDDTRPYNNMLRLQ